VQIKGKHAKLLSLLAVLFVSFLEDLLKDPLAKLASLMHIGKLYSGADVYMTKI